MATGIPFSRSVVCLETRTLCKGVESGDTLYYGPAGKTLAFESADRLARWPPCRPHGRVRLCFRLGNESSGA